MEKSTRAYVTVKPTHGCTGFQLFWSHQLICYCTTHSTYRCSSVCWRQKKARIIKWHPFFRRTMFFFLASIQPRTRRVIERSSEQCYNCGGMMDLVERAATLRIFFIPVWSFSSTKEEVFLCHQCGFTIPALDYGHHPRTQTSSTATRPTTILTKSPFHRSKISPPTVSSCSSCGAATEPDWRFCSNCGASV